MSRPNANHELKLLDYKNVKHVEILPALVTILLARLVGAESADDEESIQGILCIGVLMMQQTTLRVSPFRIRRAIQYNYRSSPWKHLIPAPSAVLYHLEQPVIAHLLK
jgi:hypothetical protein